MSSALGDVTLLLRDLSGGDAEASQRLYTLIYSQLRRLAGQRMRFERKEHTLQPTALVNEVYMRLTSQDPAINWQSRQHFFAVCARVMREILVDHARRRLRAKRGGGANAAKRGRGDRGLLFFPSKGGGGAGSTPVACADSVLDVAITPQLSMEVLALHEALQRLWVLSPRQATVIEYRFLGGVSVEATAKFLNVSPKTVKRDTTIAKAFLYGELRQGNGHRPGKVGKG